MTSWDLGKCMIKLYDCFKCRHRRRFHFWRSRREYTKQISEFQIRESMNVKVYTEL